MSSSLQMTLLTGSVFMNTFTQRSPEKWRKRMETEGYSAAESQGEPVLLEVAVSHRVVLFGWADVHSALAGVPRIYSSVGTSASYSSFITFTTWGAYVFI